MGCSFPTKSSQISSSTDIMVSSIPPHDDVSKFSRSENVQIHEKTTVSTGYDKLNSIGDNGTHPERNHVGSGMHCDVPVAVVQEFVPDHAAYYGSKGDPEEVHPYVYSNDMNGEECTSEHVAEPVEFFGVKRANSWVGTPEDVNTRDGEADDDQSLHGHGSRDDEDEQLEVEEWGGHTHDYHTYNEEVGEYPGQTVSEEDFANRDYAAYNGYYDNTDDTQREGDDWLSHAHTAADWRGEADIAGESDIWHADSEVDCSDHPDEYDDPVDHNCHSGLALAASPPPASTDKDPSRQLCGADSLSPGADKKLTNDGKASILHSASANTLLRHTPSTYHLYTTADDDPDSASDDDPYEISLSAGCPLPMRKAKSLSKWAR